MGKVTLSISVADKQVFVEADSLIADKVLLNDNTDEGGVPSKDILQIIQELANKTGDELQEVAVKKTKKTGRDETAKKLSKKAVVGQETREDVESNKVRNEAIGTSSRREPAENVKVVTSRNTSNLSTISQSFNKYRRRRQAKKKRASMFENIDRKADEFLEKNADTKFSRLANALENPCCAGHDVVEDDISFGFSHDADIGDDDSLTVGSLTSTLMGSDVDDDEDDDTHTIATYATGAGASSAAIRALPAIVEENQGALTIASTTECVELNLNAANLATLTSDLEEHQRAISNAKSILETSSAVSVAKSIILGTSDLSQVNLPDTNAKDNVTDEGQGGASNDEVEVTVDDTDEGDQIEAREDVPDTNAKDNVTDEGRGGASDDEVQVTVDDTGEGDQIEAREDVEVTHSSVQPSVDSDEEKATEEMNVKDTVIHVLVHNGEQIEAREVVEAPSCLHPSSNEAKTLEDKDTVQDLSLTPTWLQFSYDSDEVMAVLEALNDEDEEHDVKEAKSTNKGKALSKKRIQALVTKAMGFLHDSDEAKKAEEVDSDEVNAAGDVNRKDYNDKSKSTEKKKTKIRSKEKIQALVIKAIVFVQCKAAPLAEKAKGFASQAAPTSLLDKYNVLRYMYGHNDIVPDIEGVPSLGFYDPDKEIAAEDDSMIVEISTEINGSDEEKAAEGDSKEEKAAEDDTGKENCAEDVNNDDDKSKSTKTGRFQPKEKFQAFVTKAMEFVHCKAAQLADFAAKAAPSAFLERYNVLRYQYGSSDIIPDINGAPSLGF